MVVGSTQESVPQSLRNLSADGAPESARRISISQQQLPGPAGSAGPMGPMGSAGPAGPAGQSGESQTDHLLEQQVEKLLPPSTVEVVQDLKRTRPFEAISDSEDSEEEKPWEVDMLQVGEDGRAVKRRTSTTWIARGRRCIRCTKAGTWW